MIVAGTALTAYAYYLFMKPNDIIAPGLGGIVIIIGHFVPISLGFIYLLFNIPLFLLGYRYVGIKFIIYSTIGMLSMSLFLTLFSSVVGFSQPLLGCICGGIFSGIPIAFVLLAGGSTGGTDIACVVINKIWPRWTIGKIMFLLNAVIVLSTGYLYGFLKLLLTIVAIYLAGKSVDIGLTLGKRMKINISETS
ncbi:Uncharacterised 5xTM membrane BCR, YitT family COG1284 [Paenibacillus sp. yr247]|nr:Uncharacterised 5xTM membrane BCR, YitT family COG1284 [Paenibacillus sp. yr247]